MLRPVSVVVKSTLRPKPCGERAWLRAVFRVLRDAARCQSCEPCTGILFPSAVKRRRVNFEYRVKDAIKEFL
ncbi:MAG: hypothetical protein LBK25_04885 [Treponema sp.]|nr:hypothetical protein [Treponema sp.]